MTRTRSARVAGWAGAALFAAGPALAFVIGSPAAPLLAAVAVAAALYDLAVRGPIGGPLLLALCRAGNLGVGLWHGHAAAGGGTLIRWQRLKIVAGRRPRRSAISTSNASPGGSSNVLSRLFAALVVMAFAGSITATLLPPS